MRETFDLQAGGRVYPLRRAVRADLPALVALIAADTLGAGREDPGDPAPYERAFAAIDADPGQLLVVADAPDGGPAGTLQLTYIPGLTHRGSPRAQVEAVRVAAAHRGNGLGSAMIRWAAEEARRHGAGVLQLTSDKRRARAHAFYRRLGFEDSHEGFKLRL